MSGLCGGPIELRHFAKYVALTRAFWSAIMGGVRGVWPPKARLRRRASFSAGAYAAAQGDRCVHIVPVVALTLVLLSLPTLAAVVFGARAQVWLPAARHWMNNHSWIVNEVVRGIFVALSVSNI
jgi:hypothetical protein